MPNQKRTIFFIAAGLVGAGYAICKGINKEPAKYSLKWIQSLSDEQLVTERALIHKKYLNPDQDVDYRESLRRLMDLFDKVKSDRYWAGRTPSGPSYSREHGHGLYKPD